ncbi:MAG TPA: spore coat U domain-containing protein [Dokdonella sp.]|nr:spore coat U domain-containing protein [Dokdonella sp.]
MKPSLRILLLLLCAAAAPATAQNVSCSATMSNVVFGTVNPLSSLTTANATLDYTCTNTATSTRYATVCFSIGDGAQGAGQTNPREMQDAGGDVLQFQLYQNASYSTVWGSTFFGVFNTPYMVNLTIPRRRGGTNGSVSASATMYGRVNAGQTGAVPGNYQDSFAGGHTALTVKESNSSPPGSCDTTIDGNFGFTVTASVAKQCSVTATPLDFGTVGLLLSNTLGTSTIGVQCSSGSAWNVGLDDGSNGTSITTRKMASGANLVGYQLYSNAARTTVWGNTVGSNTVAGTGNGSVQNLTVYGSVPAQATPAAGTYSDTITVTVTY